jgi:glycoside/pentoside/hexuronide:cation symporter, GPH family
MIQRLPLRVKAGYGVTDLGQFAAELLLQFYLFDFYTRLLGLSPSLTGLALAVAVLWDAVTDPLMGFINDHTRSRLGRFLPYLIGGALVFAVGLAFIFNPPAGASESVLFFWLTGSYLLTNTGLTVLGVPHIAMASTLSADSDERTELYSWRLGFGMTGVFIGILAPLLMLEIFQLDASNRADLIESRGQAGVGVGFLLLVATALTVLATWSRVRPAQPLGGQASWKSLRQGLVVVFRNRYFRPILIAFVIGTIGRTINATLALPYYTIRLGLEEKQIQGPILGTFALCMVLGLPLWVFLSRRIGKKWAGFSGMFLLGVMTVVVYPLFPPQTLTGPILAAIFGGLCVGAIVLFDSLLTDVADADRLRENENREGLYFGFWRFGQKLARSLGVALTGLLVEWAGFGGDALSAPAESTESTLPLALLFGPGVGIFFITASLVFATCPLNYREQQRIQLALSQHRLAKTSPGDE